MATEFKDLVVHTDKVEQFLEESEATLKHNESYFRKRALLELKYSQDLAKLRTQYQSAIKPEFKVDLMSVPQEEGEHSGSLTVGFYNILTNDEHACLLHEEHALLLNATIVEPLSHVIDLFEQRAKQVKGDMHYQQKEIEIVEQALRRENQAFVDAETDFSEIEAAIEYATNKGLKKKDKELQKLLARKKKAIEVIEDSRVRVDQSKKEDRAFREAMKRDLPDLLEEVEMLEGWKNRGLKDFYIEYSNILLNQHQRLGQSSLVLSSLLDNTKIDADTHRFLREATRARDVTYNHSGWEMGNSSACSISGRLHLNSKGVVGAVRWKRYYFALVPGDNALYYYDNEESKRRYTIPIGQGDRIIRPCDVSLFQKDFVFQIVSKCGTVYIACSSEDEMITWMFKLREVSIGCTDDTSSTREVQSLRVNIMEAKDVSLGSYFCFVVLDWEFQARTQIKAQSTAPFWGEKFTFSNLPSDFSTLVVFIYQSEKSFTGAMRESPIGKITVPVRELSSTESYTTWLKFQDMKGNSGLLPSSLRLECHYAHEVVWPVADYQHLVDCLASPDILQCLNLMVPPKLRERTAKHMLKIYRARGEATELVSKLCNIQINATDDPNILFRGNSLASKVTDQYTKLVAMTYLHRVLTPSITAIYNCTESCEVDPSRLGNSGNLEDNWIRLLGFTEQVWMAIVTAVDKCPYELRSVMKELQKDAENHFREEEQIRYTVISGIFFLRFIVPAILNPKLFNMMPAHPSEGVARTLTLVAKTIQNLSNLVLFGDKEPFMNPMNVFLESNLEAMKNVIDRLCRTRDNEVTENPYVVDVAIEMAMLYRILNNMGPALVNYQEENKNADIEPLLVALADIKTLLLDH